MATVLQKTFDSFFNPGISSQFLLCLSPVSYHLQQHRNSNKIKKQPLIVCKICFMHDSHAINLSLSLFVPKTSFGAILVVQHKADIAVSLQSTTQAELTLCELKVNILTF